MYFPVVAYGGTSPLENWGDVPPPWMEIWKNVPPFVKIKNFQVNYPLSLNSKIPENPPFLIILFWSSPCLPSYLFPRYSQNIKTLYSFCLFHLFLSIYSNSPTIYFPYPLLFTPYFPSYFLPLSPPIPSLLPPIYFLSPPIILPIHISPTI